MSYENLKTAVLAVKENNRINDSGWKDWEDADHVATIYEIGELSNDEQAVLSRAIISNGATLDGDLSAAERKEWGMNFSPSWWHSFK